MEGNAYGAPHMFKAVFKTLALLGLLFIMLYVGMNNTHEINFHFPIAGWTDKTPVRGTAALIYFAVLAVGVLAGTILQSLSGSSGGSEKGGGKKSGGSKDR
jgi:hypothetical protein